MSAEGASIAQSHLDLYDLFSVLLPGIYLLITLIPFLPTSLPLGSIGSVAALLVGGYVVGRAIHSVSYAYDETIDIPSNRDTFVNSLKTRNDNILTSDLKDRFYSTAVDDAEINSADDRVDATDEDLYALYVYSRSQLYQHGSVRSQSFQAIYAFYRSTHFATLVAVFFYLSYGIGGFFDGWSGAGSYSTYIGGLNIEPLIIILASEVIFFISSYALQGAKSDYREYYIEYLIVDYLSVVA